MPCVFSDTKSAVAFENVSVTLQGIDILKSVTAHVPFGSWTAVVGPNGAGKTSLILALLGQIPISGAVHIAGKADGHRMRVGYVPQRLSFDRGMPLTVMEFLVMGLQRVPLWFGAGKHYQARARELLEAVHAGYLAKRRLGALSGGELQRVLLGLALEQEPQLLVLDEPASGVDIRGEQIFCKLLETLHKARGFTQLVVSHDLSMVTAHATHVICLNHGVTGEGPPREVLTPKVLAATFGPHMGLADSRALPDANPPCGGHHD